MPPAPVLSDLADEGGRGLMLLDAFAERWRLEPAAIRLGKIVWAVLRT